MKTHITLTAVVTALSALLLSVGGSPVLAAESSATVTPEMAAKADVVRSQQKQRITPAQRRAAADALKLQREKVDQAKKASVQVVPDGTAVK